MPLPTIKSPPRKKLTDLAVFFYGAPKIGKSTFCSQIEDALFLSTEPGLGFLEVYQYGDGPITTWQGFKAAVADLQKDPKQFSAVVIDTIDSLYKIASDAFCKKLGIDYPADLQHGKGWGILNNGIITEIGKLSRLGIGLWLVGHVGDVEVQTPIQTFKKQVPMLSPAIRKVLLGLCDLILFADIVTEKKEKQIIQRRILRTNPSPYWEAGGRIVLPDEIPLDYATFVAEYKKTQEK